MADASGAVNAHVPKPPKATEMSRTPTTVCFQMERGTSEYHCMS